MRRDLVNAVRSRRAVRIKTRELWTLHCPARNCDCRFASVTRQRARPVVATAIVPVPARFDVAPWGRRREGAVKNQRRATPWDYV
jgi:hypothetical protein